MKLLQVQGPCTAVVVRSCLSRKSCHRCSGYKACRRHRRELQCHSFVLLNLDFRAKLRLFCIPRAVLTSIRSQNSDFEWGKWKVPHRTDLRGLGTARDKTSWRSGNPCPQPAIHKRSTQSASRWGCRLWPSQKMELPEDDTSPRRKPRSGDAGCLHACVRIIQGRVLADKACMCPCPSCF